MANLLIYCIFIGNLILRAALQCLLLKFEMVLLPRKTMLKGFNIDWIHLSQKILWVMLQNTSMECKIMEYLENMNIFSWLCLE